MNTTRCKFRCNMVETHNKGTEHEANSAEFHPVYGDSPENQEFFKATPSGSLKLWWTNPNVKFEVNEEYFLDITKVKKPEAQVAESAEAPQVEQAIEAQDAVAEPQAE